ncbi:hypothetical protein [Maioricimonas sp. JC845]|uniref:hypothetical protein n=1 Tax=Maioricimonas sp. JC845 TaxID=3232138 RepID=UPI003457BD05
MAGRRDSRSYRQSGGLWSLAFVFIALSGVAAVATLWATGFFATEATVSREGQVAFPALARPVPAFEAVTREDLIDPKTGQLKVMWLSEEQVGRGPLRDLSKILGRVLKRDKQAGYVLTEADFLPRGSRPGVTGGAPPGTMVIAVEAERIRGLEQLRPGDRFAVYSELPRELRPSVGKVDVSRLYGGRLAPEAAERQSVLRSGIRAVTEEALLITIQSVNRKQSNSQRPAGLTVPPGRAKGTASGTKLASVAVPEEDAVAVAQALNGEGSLFVIARSSQPQKTGEDEGPAQTAPVDEKSADAGPEPNRPQKGNDSGVPVRPAAFLQLQNADGDAATDEGIAVPGLVRDVEAYETLTLEDFVDPSTGEIRYYYFDPGNVPEGAVIDLRELIGRVLKTRLPESRWIGEADLFPPATRPGISAGIPVGWTGIQLNSLQVRGLDVVEEGSRIDLVAARPINAVHLQAKAQWPMRHGEATFARADREDVFTQADIDVLVERAIILKCTEREIEVPVVNEQESAASEIELGETIDRKQVTRTQTTEFVTRLATVCVVAVPARSVPAITEALAVRSIRDGDNEEEGRNDGRSSTGDSEGEADSGRVSGDHEVAIFAVLRSGNPEPPARPDGIPAKDIVARWGSRWADRFLQFFSAVQRDTSVHEVEHIRGDAVNVEYWVNGKPLNAWPAGLIEDAALMDVLSDEPETAPTPRPQRD